MKLYRSLFFLFVVILQCPAYAESYHINTFSVLYGTTYKIPLSNDSTDSERVYFTISSATTHQYGDVFSFLDVAHSLDRNQNNTLYGEFQPRLSLNKILKKQFKIGIFNDLLLAGQLEYGANAFGFNQLNYLFGVGTNLEIPKFVFFRLNFYRRVNERRPNEWQISPAWLFPFTQGKQDFVFTGWLDWIPQSSRGVHNLHTQIQFKWDLSKALFDKPKMVYVGTEFRHWHNKFGIPGVRETVWQALLQFVL